MITNEEIAVEVMGFELTGFSRQDGAIWVIKPSHTFPTVFDPLHDHNDSAMVEEEMKRKGYDFVNDDDRVWFEPKGGTDELIISYPYKTISERPAVICKAALEAVRKENKK